MPAESPLPPPDRPWHLLVLSAHCAAALETATAQLARHLRAHPELPLADVAHTLQSARHAWEQRRCVVARDPAEAATALEQLDPQQVFTATVPDAVPEVVFLFPGQGAQHPGMALALHAGEPAFRLALDRCAEILAPRFDLLAALRSGASTPPPPAPTLDDIAIAQPAIFAVEYAMAQLWQSWGIAPSALLGHSVGEFTAACLAGVLSLEDALDLVAERARIMQEMPTGAMLAVRLPESDLRPHLTAGVELAAINAPRLCVVAGPHGAIAAFAEKMAALDAPTVPVRSSHAFHSAMMEPAAAGFAALAASVPFHAPRLPIVSTLTARSDTDFTQPAYWARQLREPVRFAAAVATLPPEQVLLEVGPGSTLTAPARQSRPGPAIASQRRHGEREHATLLEALGHLWLAGVPIEWSRLHGDARPRRVALPGDSGTPSPVRVETPPAATPTPLAEVQALLHRISGVAVEKMTPTTTLLDLGFDSLLLTQLPLALRRTFHIEIRFRQFFEELATLGALATRVAQASPAEACADRARDWTPAADPEAQHPVTIPLTPSQRGLLALAMRAPEASRAYHESVALALRGPLDVARLTTALEALVERHESLRTSLAPDGSSQTIHPHAPVTLPLCDCASETALAAEIAAVRALRFDLSRAPIWDARLLRRGPEDHVLVFTLHHIFCNGPSLDLCCTEWLALYTGTALPPAMQLRDLVARRLRPAAPASEAFWKAQFATPPGPLTLPCDRPRPAVKTYAGGRATHTLDAALGTALRQVGARHGASLFMTLLTAFQCLLHRLSGQDDLVVGVPFEDDDRAQPGGEHLLANSSNVLPLRSRIGPTTTFAERLEAQRTLVLQAAGHQDYFFGDLATALAQPFEASRAPLFDVFFTFESGRFHQELEQLQATLVNHEPAFLALRDTAIGDLFLHVTEHQGALHFRCDYQRDLFDAATIDRWLGHLHTLLAGVAADATQPVARLPLLTAAERHLLFEEWNRTALEFPAGATMHGLFEETVARQPEACAILDHGRRISYRALAAEAGAIAAQLQALGLARGDYVGVCMQRSVTMLATLLGVLQAGGAYVPLDPAYPTDRLRVMLEDSGAALVLCDPETAASHAPQLPAAQWVQPAREGEPAPVAVDGADLGYVIYTSGSTGRPKGVALEHRNAVSLIHWARQNFTPHELSFVLGSTSICFDVSIFEIFVTLAAGGTIVLAENVLELPRLPDAARVTLISTVPSAMAELVRGSDLPPSVHTVHFGGEVLPPGLIAALRRTGAVRRILNNCGPTETTTYSTSGEMRPGAPVTIGRPIANTQCYVLDPLLQPVPIGVTGEIYIGGAGVARGYLGRPELTAERFLANPFGHSPRMYRSGDLACWTPDGQLLPQGRVDDQVKIRGFRVEPGEIDTVLATHPGVREAVTVGRREADGATRLVAYLVPHSEAPQVRDLREHLRQRLPDYMVPSLFLMLPTLPHTPSGKIDRRALPEPGAGATREASESVTEPRDDEERRVAAIWREVLKIDRVSVDDNFFDLGGHSLNAMQVASRVRASAQVELNLRDVFERPTIAALAAAIRENRAAAALEEGVL